MLKVGITGNIASGKSTIEEFLRKKGFNVLDADQVAHNLLEDEKTKAEIINTFEDFDILEEGKISRRKLGRIIFGNCKSRKILESILHPLIKKEIMRFFGTCESEKIVFVSVPLLFEAKFENLFEKIILVYSDDKIRLERLMKRNNLSEEYARNRMEMQISQDKKISLADYVIYNDKTVNDLRESIEKVIELL